MAIVDIYRKATGRTGTRSTTEGTAKETWYVETDTLHEVESILNEFVQPGGVFQGRLVDSLSAADSDDGYSWLVDVSYRVAAVEDPLGEPLLVSGSQSARQVPVEFNREGKPILNSAGDPFQEILFAEDFDDTLQLTFNVATVPFAAAQQAKRTVSSGQVLGLPAGTVRYAGMSFNPVEHETLGIYYGITINLALAADWKTRILDQGFRELGGENGDELTPIQVGGKDASQPCLLDGNGKALSHGDGNGTPNTIEEDIYGEADYVSLFGIPA